MPAKSKAQWREMFVLRKQGKITQKQLDDFTKGVDYKSLPIHVKKSKKKKPK
jgi:hypothetical protein